MRDVQLQQIMVWVLQVNVWGVLDGLLHGWCVKDAPAIVVQQLQPA